MEEEELAMQDTLVLTHRNTVGRMVHVHMVVHSAMLKRKGTRTMPLLIIRWEEAQRTVEIATTDGVGLMKTMIVNGYRLN